MHAVFVKLATTGAELLGVRTPASYLHRMLRTTWVDSQRRAMTGERAIEHGSTMLLQPPPPDLDEAIDISRALADLPPLQREVIVLHLVEDFSFLEIGRLTGVSLFTAPEAAAWFARRALSEASRPAAQWGPAALASFELDIEGGTR